PKQPRAASAPRFLPALGLAARLRPPAAGPTRASLAGPPRSAPNSAPAIIASSPFRPFATAIPAALAQIPTSVRRRSEKHMKFKRPTQRYGRTTEPVTPYQRAAQVWDERIGSA